MCYEWEQARDRGRYILPDVAPIVVEHVSNRYIMLKPVYTVEAKELEECPWCSAKLPDEGHQ